MLFAMNLANLARTTSTSRNLLAALKEVLNRVVCLTLFHLTSGGSSCLVELGIGGRNGASWFERIW